MKIMSIVLACVAGAIGAAIWAAISFYSGYEIGWIAWLIGGMVGFASLMGGGKGAAMGGIAVVITLLSIFCGKVLSVNAIVDKSLDEYMQMEANESMYQMYMEDGRLYKALEGGDQLKQFMIDREYSEAMSPDEITSEEINWFRSEWDTKLTRYAESPPTFDQWRTEHMADMNVIKNSELNPISLAFQDLGLFDIVFAIIAMGTSFRLASGVEE